MTLLQIQATISTLIVAFVAIIGGNINDMYMGISVTDYLLNIKPCKILRQKYLFVESIIFLIANIVIYLMKLPLIFFLVVFALSIVTVVISGFGIFSVFDGKEKIKSKIKQYIDKNILNEKTHGNKIELKRKEFVQSFANDWANNITLQNNVNFDEYLEVFLKAVCIMYQNESQLSIDTINNVTINLCTKMLESHNNFVKLRGVRLLTDFYYKIFIESNLKKEDKSENEGNKDNKNNKDCKERSCEKNVDDDTKDSKNNQENNDSKNDKDYKEKHFRLIVFKSVSYELAQAFLELDLKDLEELFSGEFLLDEVLAIDENVVLDSDKDNLKYNLKAVQTGYESLGYLFHEKQRKGDFNTKLWNLILSSKCAINFKDLKELDEKKIKKFGIAVAKNYLCYIIGLIRYGFDSIVIEGLFNNKDLIESIHNKYHGIFMLGVFEYLYLVKYQSLEYQIDIPRTEYQTVDRIINFCKDNSSFTYFISSLSAYYAKYINEELVEDLEELLSGLIYSIDKYTLFSGKNGVKEFIALMMLLMDAYYNPNYDIDVLKTIIRGCPNFTLTRSKIENYFRMFMPNRKDLSEKVENAYKKYQEIMSNNKQIEENVKNENNSMY